MRNSYEHEDAELLLPSVRKVLPHLASLIARARQSETEVRQCQLPALAVAPRRAARHRPSGPRADLVEPVRPVENSLFVIKARHSIFYETPLEYLLSHHGIDTTVLCGHVTKQCVHYSALDAHIRHIGVTVVEDAISTGPWRRLPPCA
ncbi:isochorismatase family cysteine hydrolase [Streptomyces kronopolitis]|nr:isochorismatase family cysteine hydrolase [Streptomyces kronopolitis]